jgi:ribosomal protein L11 methyltransferase
MNYIQCQFTLSEPIPWSEILITYLAEIEFESFEQTENRVEAYIQKPLFDENKVKEVLSTIQTELEFSFTEIEDENWNAQWESSFSPIYIDKNCIIRAPFHEKEDGFKQEIIINPQMSFGTGHHQTTYLIMSEMFGIDFENKSVLDMGSGTGILAILAEKLGCKEAVAIDIDEWAYKNTIDNLELNDCKIIRVEEGGAELLTELEKYDIVLANINRNILTNDMHKYIASMKPNSTIYMSGFYTSDVDILTETANKNGLEYINQQELEGWAMVQFKKR